MKENLLVNRQIRNDAHFPDIKYIYIFVVVKPLKRYLIHKKREFILLKMFMLLQWAVNNYPI